MDDTLKEARDAFAACQDAEAENRAEALDDIRFARMEEQWPDAIREQRKREGRPCLTINKLTAFTRQVINDARQNKPSIKVHPVDSSADPATADLINGLIRNIEYTSNADVAYDTAAECAVTGGVGYFRVGIDYAHDDTFDLDILIQRIANPFSVYGDPHSTAADSSDWNVCFVTETMKKADFERKHAGAARVNWEAGYGDLQSPWVDGDDVMLAEWWRREEVERPIVLLSAPAQMPDGSELRILDAEFYAANKPMFDGLGLTVAADRVTRSWKVTQTLMTGAEVLEKTDWAGKFIPIIPVYGDEVNVEGKRYFRSLIRSAKDAQRMFNYWRTTSTELVALAPKAPFIGPKGSFKSDAAKWATANVQSHAYIEYDPVNGGAPPQRQPFAGVPAGALQEALNASDDMKAILGLYDASLGARSNETSGKAIMARQREGDVATFHFVDNLVRAIRHGGRVLLDLIPHVYTGQRIVRILGQDKKPQNVPLGQPMQLPDGTERVFDLSVGKYDLTVEAGPSFTTQREEMVSALTDLIRAYPPAAPVVGDILIRNMDIQGAEEISERLKALLPPQLQGQDPQAQQAQQAVQQLQQALEQMKADKSLDARKVDIDAYNAETKRIQATQAGMPPEAVQALVLQTLQAVLQSPDILPPASPPPGAPPMPQGMPPQPQPMPNQPANSAGFFMPSPTQ
ncbi:hypothetical protein M5E06_10355 [Azospirillum sp. A1-3]|uniref:portal protein n=1 Tax=Azospirillum sp. A1-3 TaxID=185874 RepID=UPI0020770A54|nr:portal protein [Azospirillum sp. A1-3]MCM8734595.1 hypothetical protein [Azospirillum sp. A1-3]